MNTVNLEGQILAKDLDPNGTYLFRIPADHPWVLNGCPGDESEISSDLPLNVVPLFRGCPATDNTKATACSATNDGKPRATGVLARILTALKH